MAKHYEIHIQGKQRKQIDADLMAQLVVMLGSKLAEDARQAVEAAQEASAAEPAAKNDDSDGRSRGATT